MKMVKHIFLMGIFALSFCYARQDDFYRELSAREREIAKEMEFKYLGHPHEAPLRFRGDDRIKRGQYIESDVIISD